MSGDSIAEVRGVAPSQNMDKQIAETKILEKKLQEFGEISEQYLVKDRHMKLLSEIEMKNEKKIQLSKDEILFLYEINEKITGFGYGADPRIKEIISLRDKKSDMIFAFDGKYSADEIALTRHDYVYGKTKILFGDLDQSRLPKDNIESLPDIVFGNVLIDKVTDLKGLKLPTVIYGELNLNGLKTADGLVFNIRHGGLRLFGLPSAKHLDLPKGLKYFIGPLDANW